MFLCARVCCQDEIFPLEDVNTALILQKSDVKLVTLSKVPGELLTRSVSPWGVCFSVAYSSLTYYSCIPDMHVKMMTIIVPMTTSMI